MCRCTIPASCSTPPSPARWCSARPFWLARPGIIDGAGTTGTGIRCGSAHPAPAGVRRFGRSGRLPAPGVRVARAALAFVRTVRAFGPVAAPAVRACGLTGREIGRAFDLTDRAIGQAATARIAPAHVPSVPAHVPTVRERVPSVPPFGRIAPLHARSVQPIDRPGRKRARSVRTRDRPGRKHGHSDRQPVRVCSPHGRTGPNNARRRGRTDPNSARRRSGQTQATDRMRSALRPIDPDRSRAHGLRGSGRVQRVGATGSSKRAHDLLGELGRADV